MLTCAGDSASKRSLIVMVTVSGQVPCSGAKRRGKVLDEVSTAIPGGEAAGNVAVHLWRVKTSIVKKTKRSL